MESRSPVPWTSNVNICVNTPEAGRDAKMLLHLDNPSGATCYGLSHAAMVSWIKDFSNTYHKKSGV